MGLPNVFVLAFHCFIGFGVSFAWDHSEYGRTLDIYISLPFLGIAIFCRKVKENNWV